MINEELKNQLVDRFLDRFENLLDMAEEAGESLEYYGEYIFHEWIGYLQALNEYEIISDEDYKGCCEVDICDLYLSILNHNESEKETEVIASIAEEYKASYTVIKGIILDKTWKTGSQIKDKYIKKLMLN